MKNRSIALLMCAIMASSLLIGCGDSSSTDSADSSSVTSVSSDEQEAADDASTSEESTATAYDMSGYVFGIVPRSSGNPYAEVEAEGFRDIIELYGGECIISYPESATADAQIAMIQSLISQNVDSITVAANDENALQATLQQAMDAGIHVSCVDASTNADSREVFVNQADTNLIGQSLMEAVYDITGGEGQWAILSATSQSTNQNAWIDAMTEVMESDDKYSNLELVEIAYGDDEPQKSTEQAQALLQNYPDLKVICSPTTVGISAAAKVLQDQGSDVKITGLGMPSEMESYVGDDNVCPYFFLWNPVDTGALAAYAAMALVTGDITGAAGETLDAADMGTFTIVEASDGGTEIIVGDPYRFDEENIADWVDVF